jgi:hypothetical protein
LYVGLKQDSEFSSRANVDFSFESEEVTGSLFNDEVEQTVHSAYQIHKKIHRFFYKIGNGYCRPTACTSAGFI